MSEAKTKGSSEWVGISPYRFRQFVGEDLIRVHRRRLAEELRREYEGKDPVFVGVLNGCFIFMADLLREIAIPCEVDFIKLSSYRDEMTSGEITLLKDVDAGLEGRHVVIVEDIVDTGSSVEFLRHHLAGKKPASLALVAMFIKDRGKALQPPIDYVGMEIPNDFVVGYGLDYAQQWRQLPDLYKLVED